ncbi:hypothetical protein E2C01_071708 [Portunus trituberculatus]|uniref:Uncharacterized protein n=1 Tax=Portunus trituberculatus TaxID=210409 RepID=A0A5B7I8Q1_PORTR|nr:hypothetical protein [Portunus trituberculatus]
MSFLFLYNHSRNTHRVTKHAYRQETHYTTFTQLLTTPQATQKNNTSFPQNISNSARTERQHRTLQQHTLRHNTNSQTHSPQHQTQNSLALDKYFPASNSSTFFPQHEGRTVHHQPHSAIHPPTGATDHHTAPRSTTPH